MGLFIIVLMSVATVLLIRNMNKRLRRLPDSFVDPKDAAREAEIARLDADLARSEVTPGVPAGDAVAGDADVPSTKGEVKPDGAGDSTGDRPESGKRSQ
ncbi:hypothetical protein AB0J80_17450 [Actinoplanes sp. NPDC049548]|uniref:hypothetical protein n=1 Tax=Actinoplanes sp. NPDC049548 TaxID=3155152 RepID=UPI003436821E